MIRYAVKCDKGHAFDSWFESGDSFEKLQAAKKLMCEHCDSRNITKAPMAPAVARSQNDDNQAARRKAFLEVLAQAENVGDNFVKEAKAMHKGKAEARTITGNLNEEGARELARDGVPFGIVPKYDRYDS